MTNPPMNRPGEIAGWPKLVVTYATEPAKAAALLPPGPPPPNKSVARLKEILEELSADRQR